MSYLETDWSLVDFEEPKKPAAPEKGTSPKPGKPAGKGDGARGSAPHQTKARA